MKVSELIEKLQQLPSDDEIQMWDYDWNRPIPIENIVKKRGDYVIK